jgi:hypothetical protein
MVDYGLEVERGRQERVRLFQEAVMRYAEPYIKRHFKKAILDYAKTGELMSADVVAKHIVEELFKDEFSS